MLKWLQQRSRREVITMICALAWNLATVAVMVGGRPDWSLIMIVPYGCFAFLYEEEKV